MWFYIKEKKMRGATYQHRQKVAEKQRLRRNTIRKQAKAEIARGG